MVIGRRLSVIGRIVISNQQSAISGHAENRRLTADGYKIEKILWGLPLLVFLLSCASTPKEEPLSWKVTFFSLGAKAQFDTAAPVQHLNAFNSDGVTVAQLNFPVSPRQTESLYFEWQAGETYKFEATLSTGDISVQTITAPRTYTQGNLEIAIPTVLRRSRIREIHWKMIRRHSF